MSVYLMMVLFQVKHYVADFPLQNGYMLQKGKDGTAWILPLAAHAGIHALMTLVIILLANPEFYYLAGLDFVFHFVIDRIKARYKLKPGTWEPSEKGLLLSKYYRAFGKDQLAHYLTYSLIMFLMR